MAAESQDGVGGRSRWERWSLRRSDADDDGPEIDDPSAGAPGDDPGPVHGVSTLSALLADRTPDPSEDTREIVDLTRPSPAETHDIPTGGDAPVADGQSLVVGATAGVGVGELPEGVMPGGGRPLVNLTGSSAGHLLNIPVESIQPNEFQPRRRFDEDELVALTDSIRELGVLQPILVRRLSAPHASGDARIGFELVAGERRWRAARRAGLTKVPAIVRDVSDVRSLEEAIVENLHRSDLNALEEAAAYQQLIDEFGLSQAQVAQRVGKSRSAVANTLRLTQLPVSVQRLVIDGTLTPGHARAALAVPSFDQRHFAERVVEGSLSVRQAEEMAQKWDSVRRDGSPAGKVRTGSGRSSKGASGSKSAGALEVESQLEFQLDTRVRVSESGRGGKIVIDFADGEDLHRLYQLLLGPGDEA